MKLFGPVLATIAVMGCASPRVYINRDLGVAAVLVPFNATNDADASWMMWKHVEREVRAKGYRLVPHDQVLQFYRDKKFLDADGKGESAQIRMFKTEELAEAFKADAIVVSNVADWGHSTLLIQNTVKIRLEAELFDKTGASLWKGEGENVQTRSSSTWTGIIGNTIAGATARFDDYAPGAARECFSSLPWAGYEPKPK
jgi:hypothetical protein